MTIASSMTKANRLEREEKYDDAADVYRDILRKFPKNTRARAALETLQNRLQQMDNPPEAQQLKLAQLVNSGQLAQAAKDCAALLNHYRRSPFLWEVLGKCHLKSGNLDDAATCLNKACELAPKKPDIYCALGDVYNAQGNIGNAEAQAKAI